MKLLTLPGVFAPISDSWMPADAIRQEPLGPGSKALDICTGSGVLALTAAQCGATTTAIDVSRRALLTVRLNAIRYGLRVRTLRGRTFAPWGAAPRPLVPHRHRHHLGAAAPGRPGQCRGASVQAGAAGVR
ncbi:50S ribosomal protein L11 methyltransferase [Kribbella sp. NBC_01245]|uniref:50S ribosomal protein L11 methyltransferase n=1 Tax=Kribbella sp. NBC_01245 TaxID=2903578 RepID=UPI002E2DD5F9|nr:50S ribosomal protein L11 methyltransferase [Kribbella sp. NBC_01245]